jgi:hypothetical protein
MPCMEIDKPIDQLLENNADTNSAEVITEDWSLSVPQYLFVERARIADAESVNGESLLLDRLRSITT